MQTFDSASWPIAGWVSLSPRVWNMRHGFNWDRFNSLETLWLQSLLQNGQAALLCSRHVGSNLLLVELSTSAQVSLACRHFVHASCSAKRRPYVKNIIQVVRLPNVLQPVICATCSHFWVDRSLPIIRYVGWCWFFNLASQPSEQVKSGTSSLNGNTWAFSQMMAPLKGKLCLLMLQISWSVTFSTFGCADALVCFLAWSKCFFSCWRSRWLLCCSSRYIFLSSLSC